MAHAGADNPASGECPPLEVLEHAAASGMFNDDLARHVRRCHACTEAIEAARHDNALLSEFARANIDRLAPDMRMHVEGYEIERQIESGGQGIVFKAFHRATQRPVALKMLLHGSFATSRQRRRFEREIEIAAALRHPSIVTVYDSGQTADGAHWLAMEFVDGVSLDAHLDSVTENRIPVALRLFEHLCDAVATAHRHGVIHRDLKPANVLVDRQGLPRVLDFGLARQLHPDDGIGPTRTVEGEFRGTFAYAAPEQFTGQPDDVDARSDVYALGAMLYEMLTGHHPHHDKPSMADFIQAVREEQPTLPRALNATVDEDLQTIVMKAMAKEPGRRYQSADALLADVRHYLAGEPINARRDSRLYVLRKSIARHPIAAAAAVVSVVVLIGFSVVMTMLYKAAVEHERQAEEARELEVQQRLLAEGRQRDLEQVVAFQERQVSGMNVRAMGETLRDDLLHRVQAAFERHGFEEAHIEQVMQDFEAMITDVNFTDAALRVLNDHMFAPTLAAIDEQFADQPLIKAKLLQTAASTLGTIGLIEQVEGPQTEALSIRQELLGDDHPDTLTSISTMGVLLRHLGRFSDAEPYYRKALDGRRRMLGDDHPDTLTAISNMGFILQQQGRLDEAEPYYREALERRRRVLGSDHPDALITLNNMGSLLRDKGRLAEAELHYREVFEVRQRHHGDDHPDTIRAMGNMATILREQGRLDEAAPFEHAALQGRRRLLGDQHPETILSMHHMGALLRELGRLDEAEQWGADAVQSARTAFAPGHPMLGGFLLQYGRTLAKMERFDEAEHAMLEAYSIFDDSLGPQHRRSINAAGTIAGFYDAWHLHDPDRGHSESARNWQSRAAPTVSKP